MKNWNIPVINFYLLVTVVLMLSIWFIVESRKKKWWVAFLPFLRKETTESLEQKLLGFDKIPDAVIIADEYGKITNVNKATEELFGWNEQYFKNHGIGVICPDRFLEHHQKGLADKIGVEMQKKVFYLQAKRWNKTEIPIELTLTKEKENGKYFYLSIINDITEQVEKDRKCDERIKELEQETNILNNGEELGLTGSWWWDIDEKSLIPSDGYKKIMGLDPTQVKFTSQFLRNRVWPDDDEIVQAALIKALDEGEKYDITYRTLTYVDNKLIYIRSVGLPIKNERGVVKWLWGSTRFLTTLNMVDEAKKSITQK